jgi:hypothetical protein
VGPSLTEAPHAGCMEPMIPLRAPRPHGEKFGALHMFSGDGAGPLGVDWWERYGRSGWVSESADGEGDFHIRHGTKEWAA